MKAASHRSITAAVLLSALFGADARSNEKICDSPPYGDTTEQYEKTRADFDRAQAAHTELPESLLTDQLRAALTEACKAKFAHGSRASYYRSGITDTEIDAESTTALAISWFNARNAAAVRERAPRADQDESRIYAIFLCIEATGSCSKQGSLSPLTFNTLLECQGYARTVSHQAPSPEGHFSTAAGQWLECRSKHVDTWQSAQ